MSANTSTSQGQDSGLSTAVTSLGRKLSNAGSSLFGSIVPNSPTVTSGPGVNVSQKGGKRGKKSSKSRKSRKSRSKKHTTRKNRCWSRK